MKTGHFYFGKNQTFLNWLDNLKGAIDRFYLKGYIGHSVNQNLLLVCFTAEAESIRIFSAREATKRERKDYEENVKS